MNAVLFGVFWGVVMTVLIGGHRPWALRLAFFTAFGLALGAYLSRHRRQAQRGTSSGT